MAAAFDCEGPLVVDAVACADDKFDSQSQSPSPRTLVCYILILIGREIDQTPA